MDKIDYFLTTPLKQWSNARIMEYLLNKHINLTTSEKELITSNKVDFNNPKIKLFRKLFIVNGVNIYLVIRERIEKEESLQNKLLSSISPTLSPMISPTMTSMISAPSAPSPTLSPTMTSKSISNKLVISELVLEPRIADDKIVRIEKMEYKRFINTHPPLLWKIEHFNYFMETLSIINPVKINIDELIFYTPEQFDCLFPGKGQFVYEKLREKFIKKDIVYIKPKVATEVAVLTTQESHVDRLNYKAYSSYGWSNNKSSSVK